jgi:glycolate oxidase iron-sulfur subunit
LQTNLADWIKDTPRGREADAELRKCVHCGFCLATCPTYVLLGDELDSPRGRIYLMKQMLEGAPVTERTQLHLDRCLTCRACETTCPSGVEYGRLVDIGRELVEQKVGRSFGERFRRFLMRKVIPSRTLFGYLGEAARNALANAGVAKDEIDGLSVDASLGPDTAVSAAEYFGLSLTWAYKSTAAGAGPLISVANAIRAIAVERARARPSGCWVGMVSVSSNCSLQRISPVRTSVSESSSTMRPTHCVFDLSTSSIATTRPPSETAEASVASRTTARKRPLCSKACSR